MYMLAENFVFIDFFTVKVDASADVKEGIFKEVFMFSCTQILTLTSHQSGLTAKKVYDFIRQEIVQFFSWESKDYKCLKSPQMLYTL